MNALTRKGRNWGIIVQVLKNYMLVEPGRRVPADIGIQPKKGKKKSAEYFTEGRKRPGATKE